MQARREASGRVECPPRAARLRSKEQAVVATNTPGIAGQRGPNAEVSLRLASLWWAGGPSPRAESRRCF